MYKTSNELKDLFSALSKAQSNIENATKNSINPHFGSKYANLAEVLNVIREPLSSNGLCILQTVDEIDGKIYLLTTLAHTSGQYIISRMPLLITKNDCQGLGSALTYSRRYSIAAICGIAQEDDDGNSSSINSHELKKNHEPKNNPEFVIPNGKSAHLVEEFMRFIAENNKKNIKDIKKRASCNPQAFWEQFDKWQKESNPV